MSFRLFFGLSSFSFVFFEIFFLPLCSRIFLPGRFFFSAEILPREFGLKDTSKLKIALKIFAFTRKIKYN